MDAGGKALELRRKSGGQRPCNDAAGFIKTVRAAVARDGL